jgi:hypothetical protein
MDSLAILETLIPWQLVNQTENKEAYFVGYLQVCDDGRTPMPLCLSDSSRCCHITSMHSWETFSSDLYGSRPTLSNGTQK